VDATHKRLRKHEECCRRNKAHALPIVAARAKVGECSHEHRMISLLLIYHGWLCAALSDLLDKQRFAGHHIKYTEITLPGVQLIAFKFTHF